MSERSTGVSAAKPVAWPVLDFGVWGVTADTLHMYAQMLGKVRLALSPPLPEWLNTCLYLDGRGFTTSAMPYRGGLVEMGIDVYDGVIRVVSSDGRQRRVALNPDRCVAEVWLDLRSVFTDLGIEVDLWTKPQEVESATPFSEDHIHCTFDVQQAQGFYRALAGVQGVFEEFRSPFFGRTSVQFWWGAFDLAVLLFDGEHASAPDDRGYIMRYDLDAGHLNAGLWPGDEKSPASFYAYLHPRPDGCETARVEPVGEANWVEAMGEWMLPYETVRTSPDPQAMLLQFLGSVYRVAVDRGGWDELEHTYTPPPRPRRGE